jgi:hypothetical protein
MEANGVVFCATNKKRYFEEAVISAASIRRLQPTLPISLFTDIMDVPIELTYLFTSVFPLPQGDYPRTWGGGMLARIASLACTPYKFTIHLDTDTRVLSNRFMELFEECHKYDVAMAEAKLGESFDRRRCNRRMFNPGVLVYRNEAQVMYLLSKWGDTMERNLKRPSASVLQEICGKCYDSDRALIHRLLMSDQISLVEIFGPDRMFGDVRSKVLDGCFNVRHPRRHLEAPQDTVILHQSRKYSLDHDISFAEAERYARSLQIASQDRLLRNTGVVSGRGPEHHGERY